MKSSLLQAQSSQRQNSFALIFVPYKLPIPLEDVCLPALHLDLGIFPWLYEAMLADARQLDYWLATEVGSDVSPTYHWVTANGSQFAGHKIGP